MRLLIRRSFFCSLSLFFQENSNPPPPFQKKKKKNSRSLAALALAALAAAAALVVTTAQPTSIAGAIQQIPVVGPTIKPCPPVGFDSLPNFDLTAYVSAPWYIQQQIPLVYQPVNQLYCVRAVYKPRDPANFKKVKQKGRRERERSFSERKTEKGKKNSPS